MSEPYVSEVAEAIHRLAAAGEIIGGALCAIAAGAHSEDDGRQSEMAAVFYAHCRDGWADALRKLDPKLQRDLEDRIVQLCKGKRR